MFTPYSQWMGISAAIILALKYHSFWKAWYSPKMAERWQLGVQLRKRVVDVIAITSALAVLRNIRAHQACLESLSRTRIGCCWTNQRHSQSTAVTQQVASIVQEKYHDIDEAQVTVALNNIDNVWEQLFPDEQSRIIKLMVEKIIVKPDNIDIRLWENGIERLAL